jgi:hypothetical protein
VRADNNAAGRGWEWSWYPRHFHLGFPSDWALLNLRYAPVLPFDIRPKIVIGLFFVLKAPFLVLFSCFFKPVWGR